MRLISRIPDCTASIDRNPFASKRRLCTKSSMTETWAECVCVCWVLPAPDVVSTIREIPIGVEGYDDNVDGSRAKDDGEVIGRGVQSGASCYYDSVAGRDGGL